jgi:hypothetical protein
MPWGRDGALPLHRFRAGRRRGGLRRRAVRVCRSASGSPNPSAHRRSKCGTCRAVGLDPGEGIVGPYALIHRGLHHRVHDVACAL